MKGDYKRVNGEAIGFSAGFRFKVSGIRFTVTAPTPKELKYVMRILGLNAKPKIMSTRSVRIRKLTEKGGDNSAKDDASATGS